MFRVSLNSSGNSSGNSMRGGGPGHLLQPTAIASRLAAAGRPGVVALVSRGAGAPRPEDARYSFVACDPVDASEALVPSVGRGESPERPTWIGVVPYEAVRALERPPWTRAPDERPQAILSRPQWRRYAAVVRIDHATSEVLVLGDDRGPSERLAQRVVEREGEGPPVGDFAVTLEPPDEPDAHHLERVRRALALIAAGDLYEVNLARRIPFAFRGDGVALFTSLLDLAPAPWGFFQDLGEALVIATSPELALSVNGPALRTCPIKGTRPRGRDAEEDARLARELDADPKERAELTMAVDVHRSDLGRVAVAGSVRVLGEPRVLAGRTVWSRVAEVVATRRPGVSLAEVVAAVLPCGSVTGAPKVRAMEVIATLEPWRRGLYTGAFGFVAGDRLELAMAIRTLQIRASDGRGDYFAGGGIVADSVPEKELEETRWKATQLARLAGGCANSAA